MSASSMVLDLSSLASEVGFVSCQLGRRCGSVICPLRVTERKVVSEA